MGREQPRKPTFPGLIFVASGPEGDTAAQLLIAAVESIISAGDSPMMGVHEGDLSEWIAALDLKPVGPRTPSWSNKGTSPERTAFRQSAQLFVDPRSDDELELGKLFEQVSSGDAQEISRALQSGDSDRLRKVSDALITKLDRHVGDVTSAKIEAMKAQLVRIRAVRAACLCAVTQNVHPSILIVKARQGDQEAVLELVKIDKLFLSDRCTRDVIRTASLQADHVFLKRLGASLRFKPKLNRKRSCRLYLYILLALSAEVPTLPLLHLRLDPSGTEFKTTAAFERFFQRCYKTFKKMDGSPGIKSGES